MNASYSASRIDERPALNFIPDERFKLMQERALRTGTVAGAMAVTVWNPGFQDGRNCHLIPHRSLLKHLRDH
jgi:hypothetical protein